MSQSAQIKKAGDWNCPQCAHLNFARRDACQRCQTPRFMTDGGVGGEGNWGQYQQGSAGRFGMEQLAGDAPGMASNVRPGDWFCTNPACGAHNFASRQNCFKCMIPKVGGTGDMLVENSKISKQGFKPGDWICSRTNCGEHNFASRAECFRCGGPRAADIDPAI